MRRLDRRFGSSTGCARARGWVCAAAVVANLGCGASGFSTPELDPEERPMSMEEARQFLVGLINEERARQGLPVVSLQAEATVAGQRHAEDMAKGGFTSHYGSDGSLPEQRFTDARGTGMVTENVGCFADGQVRPLAGVQQFTRRELRTVHRSFMDEVPPFDGHRRNILAPRHTHVGVGLAKVAEVELPCVAEELVDDYGTYEPLPPIAQVGQGVRVRGELRAPAEVGGVGVARVDLPRPLAAAQLNKTGAYTVPKPYETYYPAGFETPVVVAVDGRRFDVEVTLDDRGQPGLYLIGVWASFPDDQAASATTPELKLVSFRTVVVR